MIKKIYTVLILLLAAIAMLMSCQKPVEDTIDITSEPTSTPLPTIEKITDAPIAFLFLESEQQTFETLYHQLAYLKMESKGYNVKNVYVNDAQVLTGILSQLELDGIEYVVSTSSVLKEQIESYIEYSDGNMVFIQHSDEYMDASLSYELKLYEYYYLCGIALCGQSDSNIAGFIAAHPDEQTIRCINAFALGMKSVDSDALVMVSWVEDIVDENIIAQAIENLSYQKCDVYAYFIESDLVEKVADNLGSNYMTMSTHTALNPENKLTVKPSVNLDMYFENIINSSQDMLSLKFSFLGAKESIISYELSSSVSNDTKTTVASAHQQLLDGYNVFSGPLYNDIGLIVPEGSILPDEDVLDMLWFVDNVVGQLPAG